MHSGSLILFTRLPWDVTAKSRLRASDALSDELVSELHRCFVKDAIELLLATPVKARYIFWLTEKEQDLVDAQKEFAHPSLLHRSQYGKNFADRFQHTLETVHSETSNSLTIIGSDCPTLSISVLTENFSNLERGSCVIGPAPRGGFYLLGVPAGGAIPDCRPCFSSEEDRSAIQKAFTGHSFHSLPELADIDTDQDLSFLHHTIAQSISSPRPITCTHTKQFFHAQNEGIKNLFGNIE